MRDVCHVASVDPAVNGYYNLALLGSYPAIDKRLFQGSLVLSPDARAIRKPGISTGLSVQKSFSSFIRTCLCCHFAVLTFLLVQGLLS